MSRAFLIITLALVFMIQALVPLASAAVDVSYITYTSSIMQGGQGVLTVDVKNTGSSVTVTPVFVDMPGVIVWPHQTPSVYLGAQEKHRFETTFVLGSEATRRVQASLVLRTSPPTDTPLITSLVLVFPDIPQPSSPAPSTEPPIEQPSPPQQSVTQGNVSTRKSSFCSSGQQGTALVLQKAKLRSSGKKTTWVAGDTVELEVEVENTGTKTLDAVVVELGLRDRKGTNNVRDLDFKSSDKQRHTIGDLSPSEEETTSFTFTIPASLDEGTHRLLLKVYPRGQESGACTESVSDFDLTTAQTIKIEREENEERAIKFDRASLAPSSLMCGEQAQLTARVTNVGDDDQDRLKISLASKDLQLSLTQEISSGLDKGDDAPVTFTFAIPDSVSAGTYALELSAESEYKNGAYQVRSEIPHHIPVQVACSRASPTLVINKQKPLTLSWKTPEEESQAPAPESRFAFTTPQWALAIGISIVLIAIVVVALARRSPATPVTMRTPPRRRGRPPKAPQAQPQNSHS